MLSRRSFLTSLTSAVVLAALTSNVHAAKRGRTPRGPSGTFHGRITKVAGNTIQIDTGTEAKPKMVGFFLDKNSTVRGNGKQGTIDDLREGQDVTVKASNGRAESVEVTVKK